MLKKIMHIFLQIHLKNQIDKERVLKSKHEAEEKLAKLSKEDVIAFKNAEFQLKKALNRIRLVK